LSADVATALTVGKRHGKPVVLRINAQQMHGDGFDFYLSENHVWLTDAVDPKYLSVMQAHD
jgi:putative RNA 2'-phosphotransferase